MQQSIHDPDQDHRDHSPFLLLTLILVLSLILRLGIIFTIGDIALFGDELDYNRLGINIAENNGFKLYDGGQLVETSYRAPLHPLLLAGVYSIWGENYTAARVVQSLISIAAVIVFYLLGKTLFSQSAGLIAAAIIAFDPLLISFGTWLWAEPLYIFLAASSFYCLVRFSQTAHIPWLLPGGLLWGLATLTRESGQLLALLIVAWLLWVAWRKRPKPPHTYKMPRQLGRIFLPTMLFLVVMVATVAPWTYRNYRIHHAFVPVTTVSGLALWLGNNPWQDWSAVFQRYFALDTEIAREQLAISEATAYILDSQPLWLPRKVLQNWPGLLGAENFLLRHLRNGLYGPVSDNVYHIVFAISTIYYGIVGAAGIIGMWLSLKEEGRLIPGRVLFLLPLVAVLVGHTILHAHSRHRVVILPYLALFAAWTWNNRNRLPYLMRRGWVAVGAWASLAIFLVLVFPFKSAIISWLRSLFS
jgi:4-amino-4-deoxy-L-arabinose transferase-like glycosyltransferase